MGQTGRKDGKEREKKKKRETNRLRQKKLCRHTEGFLLCIILQFYIGFLLLLLLPLRSSFRLCGIPILCSCWTTTRRQSTFSSSWRYCWEKPGSFLKCDYVAMTVCDDVLYFSCHQSLFLHPPHHLSLFANGYVNAEISFWKGDW